jgi:metal-responsive CopG/Arc/MetJ family transcriptional regulator
MTVKKIVKPNARKVGRPVEIGAESFIGLRVPEDLVKRVDAWAARQDDKPPRSEAIRRMIEQALAAAQPKPPRSRTKGTSA